MLESPPPPPPTKKYSDFKDLEETNNEEHLMPGAKDRTGHEKIRLGM